MDGPIFLPPHFKINCRNIFVCLSRPHQIKAEHTQTKIKDFEERSKTNIL